MVFMKKITKPFPHKKDITIAMNTFTAYCDNIYNSSFCDAIANIYDKNCVENFHLQYCKTSCKLQEA